MDEATLQHYNTSLFSTLSPTLLFPRSSHLLSLSLARSSPPPPSLSLSPSLLPLSPSSGVNSVYSSEGNSPWSSAPPSARHSRCSSPTTTVNSSQKGLSGCKSLSNRLGTSTHLHALMPSMKLTHNEHTHLHTHTFTYTPSHTRPFPPCHYYILTPFSFTSVALLFSSHSTTIPLLQGSAPGQGLASGLGLTRSTSSSRFLTNTLLLNSTTTIVSANTTTSAATSVSGSGTDASQMTASQIFRASRMLAGLTEGQGLGSGHGQGLGSGHGQGLGSGHGGSRISTPSSSARLLTHLEGTKFNGENEASDESEKIPSDEAVPPPPPHILIVDDSQLCQKIVKKILTSCDYTYETAFNGQEAVEKLGNT